MTDIWTNSMEGWRLESAKAFDDEETLHRMILGKPGIPTARWVSSPHGLGQ